MTTYVWLMWYEDKDFEIDLVGVFASMGAAIAQAMSDPYQSLQNPPDVERYDDDECFVHLDDHRRYYIVKTEVKP